LHTERVVVFAHVALFGVHTCGRGRHCPPWQVLLPPHVPPSFVAGNVHAPVVRLQLAALSVVHTLPSLQTTSGGFEQAPF
jgi:hypothetical protein